MWYYWILIYEISGNVSEISMNEQKSLILPIIAYNIFQSMTEASETYPKDSPVDRAQK